MRLKATDQGLFIPKELLGEAQEFEIIADQEKLIITRIKKSSSIWNLGKNPVECTDCRDTRSSGRTQD